MKTKNDRIKLGGDTSELIGHSPEFGFSIFPDSPLDEPLKVRERAWGVFFLGVVSAVYKRLKDDGERLDFQELTLDALGAFLFDPDPDTDARVRAKAARAKELHRLYFADFWDSQKRTDYRCLADLEAVVTTYLLAPEKRPKTIYEATRCYQTILDFVKGGA